LQTRIVEMRGLLLNLDEQSSKLPDEEQEDYSSKMKWNNWQGGLNNGFADDE
jgi:hypothetical protein